MKTRAILSTLAVPALAAPAFAQAPAAAPTAQPAAPAPGPNTWDIDGAHTNAAFTVRHMMVSNVPGRFGKVSGTIQYDGKEVSTIAADVTIDATSITTENQKRDAHLKSPDFFDVAQFPTITFKSKRVDKGAAGQFKLIGDLTMRGVTKEVALDVEGPTPIVNAGQVSKVGATATTTINRQDYGVKWSRNIDGGGVVVADTVKITLDIEANKKNPAPPSAQ
jgi:polyisoprenoid-binding protein YceI